MNFLQTGFKGKNDWWMYVIMFVIIFIATSIGQIPITIVALAKVGKDSERFSESAENGFADIGIDSNLYFFLMLLGFIVGFFVFYLALRGMHKKTLTWIVTSRNKIDWRRVCFGVLIWGIILIISITTDLFLFPGKYEWNFKAEKFAVLCLVTFLCIPIQTTFEEVLFRGYYMQGLALWIRNKWLPLIIMSLVFGGLHAFNPEIEKLGYIMLVFYIASGLFFGIVTLLDEGAEIAMGMHAVNNVIAALFVTANWTVFQTDALYIDTSEPFINFEMFLPILILYPLALFIFSKAYKWTQWKDKLFGKLVEPIERKTVNELDS